MVPHDCSIITNTETKITTKIFFIIVFFLRGLIFFFCSSFYERPVGTSCRSLHCASSAPLWGIFSFPLVCHALGGGPPSILCFFVCPALGGGPPSIPRLYTLHRAFAASYSSAIPSATIFIATKRYLCALCGILPTFASVFSTISGISNTSTYGSRSSSFPFAHASK